MSDLNRVSHVMGEPQIIRTPSGDEMVVVPRAEYEALLAAVDEVQEDAEDLAIARHRWQEWNVSGRLTTPPDVAQMVLEGRHVLEAFRCHHGLSVDELAARSGLHASGIRQIETREMVGDAHDLSTLADALGIDRAWLTPLPGEASK